VFSEIKSRNIRSNVIRLKENSAAELQSLIAVNDKLKEIRIANKNISAPMSPLILNNIKMSNLKLTVMAINRIRMIINEISNKTRIHATELDNKTLIDDKPPKMIISHFIPVHNGLNIHSTLTKSIEGIGRRIRRDKIGIRSKPRANGKKFL
jgi:nitrogenase subunit NifH